jgi:hypothetical protein
MTWLSSNTHREGVAVSMRCRYLIDTPFAIDVEGLLEDGVTPQLRDSAEMQLQLTAARTHGILTHRKDRGYSLSGKSISN